MKKALIYIGIAMIIVEGYFAMNSYIYNKIYDGVNEQIITATSTITNYKNAEYIIDGNHVKLSNGISEAEVASSSASKIITKYFGNDFFYDFNKDGREDVVFLLTQETGGSGIFYYVVSAINTVDGYVGSQGFLIGDRIAPQTINMSKELGMDNVIVVNYADRVEGESFSVKPSIGKSTLLTLDTQALQFNEVIQDVEKEVDPSDMALNTKTWRWVSTTYEGGREVVPLVSGEFTMKFFGKKLSTFSASTDCNNIGGKFSVIISDSTNDPTIKFSDIFATKKYCENSQESEFTQMLSSSGQFHFTSRGELIIEINFGTGTMIFK